MNPRQILAQVAGKALRHQKRKLGSRPGRQKFYLSCMGIRHDGVKVYSRNTTYRGTNPKTHAEIRVLRKIGSGTVIFLARVSADGDWRMARPCQNCQNVLGHHGIKRIYYTVGPGEFGTMTF